jgi:RNase P subunit RPR2
MIDLGTIAGLFEHEHKLAPYCPRCERWSVLPLTVLVGQGQGSLSLPIRAHCRDCGEVGRLQVRPPVPTQGHGGWGESP